MSKTYEQLMSEVSVVAAEIFNGREFTAIEPDEDPVIGQIASGSERHLSGTDDSKGGTVDATEQYILKRAGEGRFLAQHCLELAWGNYNEDEIVMVNLDARTLNDANWHRYRGPEAITMAERVLQLLQVVKPAELHTTPETDFSGIEQHLAEVALDRQVALNKMNAAVADSLLGHVALIQHRGGELSEEKFNVFVETIKLRHDLTEAEVDRAVDLRMQEIHKAEQLARNTSKLHADSNKPLL